MSAVELSPYQTPIREFKEVEKVFDLDIGGDLEEACRRVLTGEIAVVCKNSFPFGILDTELALRFAGLDASLPQLARYLRPIGLTPPDMPLGRILHSLLDDRVIPWFVLTEEKKSVGAVPPLVLAGHLVALLRSRAEGGAERGLLRQSGKRYLEALSYVDPQEDGGGGPPKCYCCPDALNNTQPHQLTESEIVALDNSGHPLCPDHTRTRVVVSLNCANC